MAWDVKKFMDEYNKGECDNPRCKNRREQAMDTATTLRDTQAVLRRVMLLAKQELASNQTARDIYQTIADHNTRGA